ncbi:hypothetical protein D3C77_695230 [compost metagenome]
MSVCQILNELTALFFGQFDTVRDNHSLYGHVPAFRRSAGLINTIQAACLGRYMASRTLVLE